MNILIYIPELDQSWGGVRQYSIGLIRILAQDRSNIYFVYHNNSDPEILNLLTTYPHLQHVVDSNVNPTPYQIKAERLKKIANSFAWRLKLNTPYTFKSTIDKIIDKFNIQPIHCPYQFIPVTTYAKLITTLHDVQEIHFPGFFTAEARAYRAVNFLDYLRRADKVVVSYDHVKADLIKYFSVPQDNIHTILLDMGNLWFERYLNENIVYTTSLHLPEQYILYPANTWEHKNHLRLLQAVALLRDKYGCVINLVCSGHKNQYYDDTLSNQIEALKLQKQVQFIGVVEERDLFELYRKCLGVVVPTLYEAGSFPLMESMLMKVPVVCSNVTSLPETIGNKDFLFDPFDIDSIAKKMGELWTSKEFRQKSIDNSSVATHRFLYTNSLEKLTSLYRGA